MKLRQSKEWYERRIAAEGNAEVGGGIPPWSQPHAGTGHRIEHAHAIQVPKPPKSQSPQTSQGRRAVVVADKVLCHS